MTRPDPEAETARPDDYAEDIAVRLPPERVRELSRLTPWRTTCHLALEWGGIVAAIALCHRYWHPALYVLAVLWIGARQHALGILMHEGTHYRLYSNRRLNDFVGEVLLAWPLFFTMRGYAAAHVPHHRFVNTERDPDWVRKQTPEWDFPMPRGRLARILLMDLTGLNTLAFLGRARALAGQKAPLGFTLGRVAFYTGLLGAIALTHAWVGFLIYWVVPSLTWTKLILRWRSIAEHFAVENRHPANRTRTVLPTWLERLFVAPKNIHFHIEHHLYPSVPFYRLPALHALLMDQPEFREHAHLTRSYWNVLTEATRRP
jgi:fatty acid desaturase